MPKLRMLSATQVCKILRRHGFLVVRQSGSHIILRRELADRGITVPVPNHSEIARGTLKKHHRPKRDPKIRVHEVAHRLSRPPLQKRIADPSMVGEFVLWGLVTPGVALGYKHYAPTAL
jgi:predicted RNA binding protein YcfA (HicA-like mRNA interferase family)